MLLPPESSRYLLKGLSYQLLEFKTQKGEVKSQPSSS